MVNNHTLQLFLAVPVALALLCGVVYAQESTVSTDTSFRVVRILQDSENPNIAGVEVFGVFQEGDDIKVYANDRVIGGTGVAAEEVAPEGASVTIPGIVLNTLDSGRNIILARIVRDGVEIQDSIPFPLILKTAPPRPSVIVTTDEAGAFLTVEVSGRFTENDRVAVFINSVEFTEREVADDEIENETVVFSGISSDEFNNGENTVEAIIRRATSADGTDFLESDRGATAQPVVVSDEVPEEPEEEESAVEEVAEEEEEEPEPDPEPVIENFQCVEYTLRQKIFEESDRRSQINLGKKVAIDGNIIVATGGDHRTRAYHDSGESWNRSVVIVGRDYTTTDSDETAVTVVGDTVAIGTPKSRSAGVLSGGVHFYHRTPERWMHQGTLAPSTLGPYSGFGTSIAMSNTLFAAGAQERDLSGSVYVYTNVGGQWAVPVYLSAPDSVVDHRFGTSVSVDGTTIAVGAPGDTDNNVRSGAVYVYIPSDNQWVVTKITPEDGTTKNSFGETVLLRDGFLIVGAERSGEQGAVYVYTREGDSWVQVQKLEPIDSHGKSFGASFAYARGLLLIGAPNGGDGALITGALYPYIREGGLFSAREKIIPGTALGGDKFGASVSFDGEHFAVGAYRDDTGGNNAGAVYVYRADNVSCNPPEEEAVEEGPSVQERKSRLRELINAANELIASLVRDTTEDPAEEEAEEPEQIIFDELLSAPDTRRHEAESRGLVAPGIPGEVVLIVREEGEEEAGEEVTEEEEVEEEEEIVAPQAPPAPVVVDLKLGDTGEIVRILQMFLNERGYTISGQESGEGGGIAEFDNETERALKRFQLVNGIPITGILNEDTRSVIRIYDPSF